MGLIENFYDDAAVVQVFNNDLAAKESDGLRDDVLGFTFAISVGDVDTDGAHYLSPVYADAEIKSIYVCKKRVIKVLVQPQSCNHITDDGTQRELNRVRHSPVRDS